MDWIEVTIKTTTEGADTVAQSFYEVGVLGVVIEDPDEIRKAQLEDRTWDYIDDSILANMEEKVLVKGYLNDDVFFLDKLLFIKERIQWLLGKDFGLDLGSLEIALTNVCEEDWAHNWKKYYKPIKVSDRVVIKPTWEEYTEKPGEHILELDPGMAFGTGTHETTMLCIRAIDKYIKPGMSVVDIGCGTGVLAIAALLLGADKATAIDLDSNAVKIASENALLNKVADRMEAIHGNLLDKIHSKYDIVVANIIADIVINLSEFIQDFMNPEGVFISSGIILDRLEDVTTAIETAGLEIIHKETMGEWAVVVSRQNA
ncbi:MAG: 50S ribosomal protein L11 methyltransferase [Firmicutes bacterium]|nr:50S ribosomal protein L11 methyltransferase [Bacillota bacterium]